MKAKVTAILSLLFIYLIHNSLILDNSGAVVGFDFSLIFKSISNKFQFLLEHSTAFSKTFNLFVDIGNSVIDTALNLSSRLFAVIDMAFSWLNNNLLSSATNSIKNGLAWLTDKISDAYNSIFG